MLTLRVDKAMRFLIVVVVCLTPIFAIEEQLYYLGITSSRDVSSLFVKAIKDVIFFCIYVLFILKAIKRGKLPRTFKFLLPIYGLIAIGCCLSPSSGIPGLRWSHVFLLCLCLYECIDMALMRKLQTVLNVLMFLQVVVQIAELFIMPPVFGRNFLGLASRCPGFFVQPSSAGAFLNLVFLMSLLFPIHNRGKRYALTGLVFLSQLICMSSTGATVLLALIFFNIFQNRRTGIMVLILFLMLIPFTVSNMGTLSGRSQQSIEISGSTRIEIMMGLVKSASVLPRHFGLYTNTAVSMELPGAVIADSSVVSILANLGWIGLIYIALPLGYVAIYAFSKAKKPLSLCLIALIGLSLPIITMEMFPVNLFIAILFNFMLHNKNYTREKATALV